MDLLKKFFPISFKYTDTVANLIIGILIYVIGNVVAGAVIGLLAGLPLIGWLFSLAGSLVCFALFCVGLLCFVQMMTHDNVVELPYVGGFRLLP